MKKDKAVMVSLPFNDPFDERYKVRAKSLKVQYKIPVTLLLLHPQGNCQAKNYKETRLSASIRRLGTKQNPNKMFNPFKEERARKQGVKNLIPGYEKRRTSSFIGGSILRYRYRIISTANTSASRSFKRTELPVNLKSIKEMYNPSKEKLRLSFNSLNSEHSFAETLSSSSHEENVRKDVQAIEEAEMEESPKKSNVINFILSA